VSIVTVFNDPDVRRACLDRSIETHRAEAPAVEYLPIDNVAGTFASAGAALNHGASMASHDYVVFVHQDVYLHSLVALEEAAGMLADDEGIALLGAIGPTAEGRFFGRIRDRVFLLGDAAAVPAPVDCVDEVLFVVPRRVLEREPLPEVAELAWHAYAVEYGLRARAHGLRVCAVDIPLTHNSLTVNLDRLEVAYAAVAAAHPARMPVYTPQGLVGGPKRTRERITLLSAQRWRYRWLRESRDAHAGRRAAAGSPCVLADVRLDVDELLARLPPSREPLLVVSVEQQAGFADERPGPLALTRNGRSIRLTSRSPGDVAAATAAAGDSPVLITNLGLDDVRRLAPRLPAERRIVGFRTSLGYWMLIGVPLAAVPAGWRSPQATPLGMRVLGA
jgi:Glycosyltransferase like family